MAGIWLVVLAAVVIVCGFMARRKVRRVAKGQEPVVTDEVLRKVLGEGMPGLTEPDESLDEDQIRKAEDEFWSTEWDDPEPWES